MNETHERMIQRFVDHELDAEGRAQFLAAAEANPGLWREAVLSIVENRIYESVVKDTTVNKSNDAEAAVRGAGTAATRVSARPQRKSWWSAYGPQVLVTAASVLFVFALAMRFNPIDTDALTNDSTASVTTGQADGQPDGRLEAEREESPLGPTGSQLVNEPYRLQMNDMDLPVYQDRELFRKEIQRQLGDLDPALVQRFVDKGYRLKPHVRYLSGRLADGRSVVMPVQSFQVQRIGQ